MKKIKIRVEGKTVAGKEFKPVEFLNENKSKFINGAVSVILIILCIWAVAIWKENKKVNAAVLVNQAKNLFYEGKYDASLAMYKDFLKTSPNHKLTPAALIGIAYCYEELNKNTEAKEAFLKIEKQFPNSPWNEEAVKGIERLS